MIKIERDGETRNCHKSELKRMQRQGWTPQQETNPDPAPDAETGQAPQTKQEPAQKTQGTKPGPDKEEKETVLYKRLKGEWVEGQEPPKEVIVNEESFPDELVETALQEGWYKTKDEASNAAPDKQMSEQK